MHLGNKEEGLKITPKFKDGHLEELLVLTARGEKKEEENYKLNFGFISYVSPFNFLNSNFSYFLKNQFIYNIHPEPSYPVFIFIIGGSVQGIYRCCV